MEGIRMGSFISQVGELVQKQGKWREKWWGSIKYMVGYVVRWKVCERKVGSEVERWWTGGGGFAQWWWYCSV